MRHLQRAKDFPGAVFIQRGPGYVFDQRAQGDEIGVTVDEPGAGRINRSFGVGQAQSGFPALPGRIEIEISAQAGVVSQQVTDGDVFLAILSEFGNVFCYRIIQPDFTLLHQLHHGGGRGDHFGERCQIENSVGGHGLAAGLQRAIAEGFAVDDLSVVPDQQHGAGHLVVVDGVEDDGVEDGEFWIAGGLGGGRRRQMGKKADNK